MSSMRVCHVRPALPALSKQSSAASRLRSRRPTPTCRLVPERDRFIGAPAAAATVPVRVRRDAKQKPILGVERELDGWAWVKAVTGQVRRRVAGPPRIRTGRAPPSSQALAGDWRRPASTRCALLANARTLTRLPEGPRARTLQGARRLATLPVRRQRRCGWPRGSCFAISGRRMRRRRRRVGL